MPRPGRAVRARSPTRGGRDCPSGEEFVPVDALECDFCPADLEPGAVDDEPAGIRARRTEAQETARDG